MHPDAPRPVFFDPHQRRWRWFRRLGFGLAAATSVTLLALVAMILVNPALPALGLPATDRLPQAHHLLPPRPERPLRAAEKRYRDTRRALAEANAAARRVRLENAPVGKSHPTELIAFFVNWDDTSFTSLKQNVGRIDTLVPEWLHLADGDGRIALDTPSRQQEVLDFLRTTRPGLRIVPLVNNFNTATTDWESERVAAMLGRPEARATAIASLADYVQSHRFAGISVDFESVPAAQRGNLVAFMRELAARFHPLGLQVSQSVPLEDPAFDYEALAAIDDYVLLMAYDEHAGASSAGPGRLPGLVRRHRRAPVRPGAGREGRGRARQLRLRLEQPRRRHRSVVPGGDPDRRRVRGPRRTRRRVAQSDLRVLRRAAGPPPRLVPRRRHRLQPAPRGAALRAARHRAVAARIGGPVVLVGAGASEHARPRHRDHPPDRSATATTSTTRATARSCASPPRRATARAR